MENENDEILTTEEVAKLLKCSTQIVRRLNIPRARLGSLLRYKKSDVDAWIEAHKENAG